MTLPVTVGAGATVAGEEPVTPVLWLGIGRVSLGSTMLEPEALEVALEVALGLEMVGPEVGPVRDATRVPEQQKVEKGV